MSLNKVITCVNTLANSVAIPPDQSNNVICIDTLTNRIGVKIKDPTSEIDINGTLKTNYINIKNNNNPKDKFDISYDASYLSFNHGLHIQQDISCESIFCESMFCKNIKDLSSNTGKYLKIDNIHVNQELNIDLSLNVNDISANYILVDNISANYILTETILADLIISQDISGQSIACEKIETQNLNTQNLSYSFLQQTSDDRFKHNEKNINNGLEIIRQLQPQIYDKTSTFKIENYKGKVNEPYIVESGLIAQEVYAINDISYVVTKGDEIEPYYLNYNNIFVYGLAGLKELDKIVNNNINDISNLSHKLTIMENKEFDISNVNLSHQNLSNIKNILFNQGKLIELLNNKVKNLEKRTNNIENK